MARLEGENSELSEPLETRKVIERAKGILQRDLQLSEQKPTSRRNGKAGNAANR
jgi:AmiR/NasT family two-component response regulator